MEVRDGMGVSGGLGRFLGEWSGQGAGLVTAVHPSSVL